MFKVTNNLFKKTSRKSLSAHATSTLRYLTVQRVVFFAFIAALLLPLVSPALTSAAPAGEALYASWSPKDIARSASFFDVLESCIKNDIHTTITQNASSSGPTPDKWFMDNSKAKGVVFPKGQQDCKDFAGEALNMWGYTNETFLKALGYTQSGLVWNGPTDRSKSASSFRQTVGNKLYKDSGTPTINDAAKYELYMYGLMSNIPSPSSSGCFARDFGVYPTGKGWDALAAAHKTEKVSENNNYPLLDKDGKPRQHGMVTYQLMHIVNSAGADEIHAFAYLSSTANAVTNNPRDSTAAIIYGYTGPQGGYTAKTCDEMATAAPSLVPAWIKWNVAHDSTFTPPSTTGPDEVDKPESTCQVDGIGWIVCPVMRLMANIVDAAYGFVSSLLEVQPLMLSEGGNTSPTYTAWSAMRNFANVAFVIAFVVIIYSQLTGAGINNYGIKKMLPRLVVAAILVNASYWICAIAVDLSNIIGSSANGLFDNIKTSSKFLPSTSTGLSITGGADASGWIGLTGAVLVGAGIALYAGLAALVPALLAVIIAIVTVFLVLTLRQALIILLVIISPLAFVAFLLPNTENLFKKWRQLFQILLLMYPIIAFLFGASALASTVVMAGADGPYKIAIQIMGAMIAIIPLALTPIVMKTAGGVLNRFGGMVNNPNKGPIDKMKKGAARMREDQEGKRRIRDLSGGPSLGFGKYRRQAKREAVSQGIKSETGRATSQYVAGEIEGNEHFRNRVAGGSRGLGPDATNEAMQRALSSATLTIDKATAENIQAESVMVQNFDKDALKGIVSGSSGPASDERKAAAMQRLIKIADPADYESEVNSAIQNGSSVLRRATADALSSNGPSWMKASDTDMIATGTHTAKGAASPLAAIAKANAAAGVISQEKMVEDTFGNLQFAWDASDNVGKQNMVNTAAALKANTVLKGKIKHNANAINNLSVATRP